jgi:hypothetical protein
LIQKFLHYEELQILTCLNLKISLTYKTISKKGYGCK